MPLDWKEIAHRARVCGRIKSDYRYTNQIVYNNFPWPDFQHLQSKIS